MIYRWRWLDKFMKRWFLNAYFKRYFKKHPEAYQVYDDVCLIDVTQIIGNTKHKDSKIKETLDQIITNGDFSSNVAGWNGETLPERVGSIEEVEAYFEKVKSLTSQEYMYSPIYDTTLDKLTDEEIKEQIKVWVNYKEINNESTNDKR